MPSRDLVYERIYALVDSIPPGRVATYGQIAREAGVPRNARQVGRALRVLPAGSPLPWHRVVDAHGTLRARSPSQRRRLLDEGVELRRDGRVDLARFGWTPDW